MATTTYLGGKAELAFGTSTIEPQFLGDITVNYEEGTRSVNSLAGVVQTPSGNFTNAQITGTFIVPSMDALNKLYAHLYTSGTKGGRITICGNTCTMQEPKVVNIHFTCETDSANDFHANQCVIKADFNVNYNTDGVITIPFTILSQPDADGEYGYFGAGSLTKSVLWDATSQAYVDVPVSA